MKNSNRICFLLTILLISSCGIKRGYVRFSQRKNELIATEAIKSFLIKNPHPSIVLRVPQASMGATQSDQNSYIYTAIEKELVLGGFQLKDRGLLNQVVNSQSGLDYSKISEYTVLILELVTVDTKIPYETNRAFTKKDKERILKHISYTRYGATIEFKIIIVKNNEFGGSYSFMYSPCTEKNDNCYCKVPYKYVKKFYPDAAANFCGIDRRNAAKAAPVFYETIPQDVFELFVRDGVKKVISEIRH